MAMTSSRVFVLSLALCLAVVKAADAASPTTTLLISRSPNPSLDCETLTFIATVSVEGGGIPTGTVLFTFGDRTYGPATLLPGVATQTVPGYLGHPPCKSGSHPVTATYSGDTNFLPSTSNTLIHTVRKGVAGDFNGDGKADILRRSASGLMERWLMDGPAVVGTSTVWAYSQALMDAALQAEVCSTGHFLHEDGRADLAFCFPDGGVMVWITAQYGVNSNWPNRRGIGQSVVAIDDFSGNGTWDVLVRDAAGAVGMWVIDGEAETRFLVASPGLGYEVAGTGDFDGDGKADILLRDAQGGLGMWFMNGPNIISGSYVGAPGPAYRVAGTGDFDGDGKADILLRDADGDLAVCLMNGATIVRGASISALDPSYSIAAVRDYDGDQRADILLLDPFGSVGMWLMDGTTIRSGAYVRWSGTGSQVY